MLQFKLQKMEYYPQIQQKTLIFTTEMLHIFFIVMALYIKVIIKILILLMEHHYILEDLIKPLAQ